MTGFLHGQMHVRGNPAGILQTRLQGVADAGEGNALIDLEDQGVQDGDLQRLAQIELFAGGKGAFGHGAVSLTII